MDLNKNSISQIQTIITNAQQKAIRSVDFERYLCIGISEKWFLKKNSVAKTGQRMVPF